MVRLGTAARWRALHDAVILAVESRWVKEQMEPVHASRIGTRVSRFCNEHLIGVRHNFGRKAPPGDLGYPT